MNFLQGHYNEYRKSGGDHATYAVLNDLSDELSEELEREFETNHPPVPEEKQKEFAEKLRKESEEARIKDDIAWLTGTGRFGQ